MLENKKKPALSAESRELRTTISKNKLKKAYLDTPIFKFLLKKMRDDAKARILAYGDDDIFLEDTSLPAEEQPGEEMDGEALEIWSEVKQHLKVHLWRDKGKLDVFSSYRLNSKAFLKTLNIRNSLEFTNLRQLMINVEKRGDLTSQDIDEVLCYFVRHLSQLRDLQLGFVECNMLTDESLKIYGSVISRNLTNLVSLTLYVRNSNSITDQGLKNFVYSICRHLPKLKELDLSLPGCGITDQGMRSVASMIASHLTGLQSFEVSFGSSQEITDDGFIDLISNISQNLSDLRVFWLSFFHTPNITDRALEALKECITQYLPRLQFLRLAFSVGANLTDVGLRSIFSSINHLFILKKLNLDFSYSSQITENGLKSLDLSHMPRLEHLSLTFSMCSAISNQGFKEVLLKILSSPFKLNDFFLDVKLNTQINDEILEVVASAFSTSLATLASFSVYFDCCKNVSDKGLEMITSNANKHLSNLETIELFFYSSGVTQEAKAKAKQALMSVSKVEIS